jgi:hypothetical protein
VNNVTAKKDADGSVTIQFGGCDRAMPARDQAEPALTGPANLPIPVRKVGEQMITQKATDARSRTVSVTTARRPARIAGTSALILLLLLGGVAWAQGQADGQQKIQAMMDAQAQQVAQQLSLTPDQTAQLKQINLDALGKMKPLKAQSGSDKKAMAKGMQGILKDRQAALAAMMSPEQLKAYQPIQQADTAAVATNLMAGPLQLTDDQIQKITQINLKAIQNLTAASGERRRLKKKREMGSTMEEREAALKNVLTPPQWATYQQMKAAK